MSLLTDDEIYGMYSEPSSDAEMVAFARAIEAAILAKLASAELPEWSKRDDLGGLVPSEIRQALYMAQAQGAASQLSVEPAVWAMRDALDELSAGSCVGFTVGVKTDWRDVPLFTLKEPK